MDKYKFWIIFIAILMGSLIIISAILGLAWVNSPTTWSIEIGLDDASLQMMNSTLELAESMDGVVDTAGQLPPT